MYASSDAQIFGLILNCLFMVSHYIFDALDVCFFLGLFFFRSILDGSQYLEKINTHFYVWETSSFQSFIVCFGNVKESLSLRKLILDCKNNGTSSFHWVMTKNNNSVLDSEFTVGCYGSVAT